MSTPNPFGFSSAGTEQDQATGLAVVEQPKPEFLNRFGRKPNRAADVVEVSRDTNPDQEAKKRGLATRLEVSPETVDADPEGAEARVRDRDTRDILERSRVTARFVERPENARIAHDSVEELSYIEGLGNSFVRSWLGIKQGVRQFQAEDTYKDVLDSQRTYSEILNSNRQEKTGEAGMYGHLNALYRYATTRLFPTEADEYVAAQKKVSDIVEERSKFAMSTGALNFMKSVEDSEGLLGTLATIGSDLDGMTKFSSEVGLEFLPQMILAGVATHVTRNPSVGATFMGTLSGATERYRKPEEFLRAAGIDTNDPQALEALLTNPALMEAAQEHGFTRGAIIGGMDALSGGLAGVALAKNPLGSLMLQTALQASMGGGGEALAQLGTDGKITNVNEIIFEALGEFATAPIEVAVVGGRPLISRLRDGKDSAQAQQTVTELGQMAEALKQSRLTQRAPDVAAEHVAEVMSTNGVDEFFIPADVLQSLEIEGLVDNLGVTDQMADAMMYGGDVRIGVKEASQYILQDPATFEKLKGHIRTDAEGLTAAEGQELDAENEASLAAAAAQVEAEGVATEGEYDADSETARATREVVKAQTQVSRDTNVSPEVENSAVLAEHEAGVAALFLTAKDAGFTETQYASYIEAIQNMKTQTRKRAERKKLNREKKRLSAEYQKARETELQPVQETLSQEPIHSAVLGIGVDRLDYKAVRALLQDDPKAMARLPKSNGRRLYTAQGVKGLDPEVYADIHGFPSADVMLFAMMDSPTYEQAVETEVTRRVEQKYPTLIDMRGQIDEAMESLHEASNHGTVLAFELARLRQMRGKKKIQHSLIKSRARSVLKNYRISNINTRQLEQTQRREARRAAQALRAGDLDLAAKHKLNQAVAFEMTKESYKVKREIEKGNKAMSKLLSQRKKKRGKQAGLPIEYLEKAQSVLRDFQFGSLNVNAKRLQRALDDPAARHPYSGILEENQRLYGDTLLDSPAYAGVRADIKAWAARKREEEGIVMHLGDTVTNSDGTTNYQNLTLDEWRDLRNSVDEIVQAGLDANKLRNAIDGVGVEQVVGDITGNLRTNVAALEPRAAKDVKETTTIGAWETGVANTVEAWEKFKLNIGAGLVLNMDSLLRQIDGFKSLGPAYTYLKGGIDRAFTEGYMPNQIGYAPRIKKESETLKGIFDKYSKSEQNAMSKEQDIPDVGERLTKFQQIGVMLNMGNAGNYDALIESKQFTEAELQAIVHNASKKDVEFVQEVWDFFSTFESEVKSTVRRRQNRDPVMVEAQPLVTSHGTLRGGYFPLQYDSSKNILNQGNKDANQFNFEEARDAMLRGGFSSSHTQDGHTQTRDGSGGRKVKLDPFIINQHLQQLVYDLEVGDAVYDSFKVLHNSKMKDAFSEIGKPQIWQAMDLWLGDVITGEIHRGGFIESSFRRLRTGTTISKLAWNVTTAALQPLGLIQTSVQIGRGNTFMGLHDLLWGQGKNPKAMYDWVTEQSGFMASREQSYNKDIHDAQKNLVNSWVVRNTPGNSAQYVADSFFYFITKAQRFVDIVTWLGAKRQGQQMFPGDDAKATLHADRMVARTQGSGNFHERTNVERGTISRNVRNTETIRAWSMFLSYFAAKLNVAYERTKGANFKGNPMEYINYPVDMAMLFMVEGVLSAIVKQGLPEDEDDDGITDELAGMMVWEGVKGFSAGIPFARETISAVEGFSTGGAVGGFAESLGQAYTQIEQGEIDAAALKSINNVAGVLFKYPTSQVNKTFQAIYEDSQEFNEVEYWHYLTGVPRKR